MSWIKIDDYQEKIKDESWSLYWNEMKTGTKTFEEFILNPLPILTQVLDGVDDSWTVITTIIHHERGLEKSAVCQVPMVDYFSKTVHLTLYKH